MSKYDWKRDLKDIDIVAADLIGLRSVIEAAGEMGKHFATTADAAENAGLRVALATTRLTAYIEKLEAVTAASRDVGGTIWGGIHDGEDEYPELVGALLELDYFLGGDA